MGSLQKAALVVALLACACASDREQRERALRKSIAMELLVQRDWAAAFNKVRDLHAEDPRDPDVLTMRGIIFREKGMAAEAEADFVEALAIHSDRADTHSALAVMLEGQGRGKEALEHHRAAADLAPESPDALNNLAFALFARNQRDESIALYKEALRLDPTSARVRNNLGFAYARGGDFAKASREFASGGSPAEAKNNLGFAYEKAGNLAAAYDLYQQALALQPGHEQAWNNLVEIAKKLDRPGPEALGLKHATDTGERDAKAEKPN